MQLNFAQFLEALTAGFTQGLSAQAGIVTLESGDTFDISSIRAAGETITPLAAAGVLTAIQGDEPAIVEAFRTVSQGERNRLGQGLASFYQVLCMESKFQPDLLDERIKIPVTSFEEGLTVQQALFNLGCGFHHGSWPLAKELSNLGTLSGIFVSRKGVISVMPSAEPESEKYVAKHESRAVSPAAVLTAKSLGDLLSGASQ